MSRILLALALAAVSAAAAGAEEKTRLPGGPPPRHVLAKVTGDKVEIRDSVMAYREEVRMQEQVVDGKPVKVAYKVAVPFVVEQIRAVDAGKVRVYGSDGKPVDADKVPDLLKKETHVLVASGGRPPDPFYLEVLKPGTLILVLPEPGLFTRGRMGRPLGESNLLSGKFV